MELEIWTDPEPTKKEPTRVRLVKVAGDRLKLCVVDAKGVPVRRGAITDLSGDGLNRRRGLSPDLGFPLDDEGRIRVV